MSIRVKTKAPSRPGKHPGGRPRKFAEASRPITVTLPERTLRQLEAIDRDRARALVRVTDMALPDTVPGDELVDVVEVAPGLGMIVVGPSRYLRNISLIRLVEVAPSRFLLTIPSGTAIPQVEVALADILEDVPANEPQERDLLAALHDHLRRMRRADQVSKAEVLFVAL